jgi:thymidine kinase
MKREVGLVSVIGNMFGGKSAETVRLANIEQKIGRKVQAFKPGIDSRYGDSYIMTHDGAKFPARSVRSVSEMRSLIDKDTDVLVWDEDQFWDEELYDFAEEYKDRLMIINNSLQFNYRGQTFNLRKPGSLEPSSSYSGMDIANLGRIITAYPQCLFREDGHVCRAQAIYPQRFNSEKESLMPYEDVEIVLGAGDKYSPRCVNHFARPLKGGSFLYQGTIYSSEELMSEHPEIFK